MYLQHLAIHGIRNIGFAELTLSPQVNLIFGVNGSGKSSILESIYLLSRGRSFRTRHLRTLMQHNQSECTCYGLVQNKEPGGQTAIGINRQGDGTVTIKVGGEVVNTASRLAEALPVQLINADSFDLLTGSPVARRAFLDWGVFHVEQSFRDIWSRFQRCLKQRNSLLRHDKIDRLQMAIWDREFCALSRSITVAREQYLAQLMPILNHVIGRMKLQGEYSFRFDAGWNRDVELETQLSQTFSRDRKMGFTQQGPHRADIRILCDGRQASQILSRGQSKMLVASLKLAQGQLFSNKNGDNCLFLLDDLPSELDGPHRQAIGQQLLDMGAQVFLTAVEKEDLEGLWGGSSPLNQAMFHVEHGEVEKQR
jgi:DNA replication and repair protein RecF